MDKDAINLAKAIRRAETGNIKDPYNAKGASGEIGGYQFMPDTWRQWSKQYLGQENAPLTVANQNKVAYARIKELKDKGLTPAQIASVWNSGNPDAYKAGKKGINSMGVEYDVPAYVSKVSANYRAIKGTTQAPVEQTQPKVFKYDVPENKQFKTQQIQQQAQTAQKEADKYKGIGFLKQFGKELVSNFAPSEVGLGKTIQKTFGNQSDQYVKSIETLSKTQTDLVKAIKEKESRGEDATRLKQLYNQNVDELATLQSSLQEESKIPTTGKVAGQLGGTALDLLTAGTYGTATKGMKFGRLATSTKVPSIVSGARKTTGLFSLPGASKVATGAGIGYGFDVTQGLQGNRGEDRTGANAFIPGAGTLVGGAIPAVLQGEQTVKNLFNKETKTKNLITKRTSELSQIVDSNSSLRNAAERSKSKGFNVVDDIANTDLLANSVDNTGTIRTTNSIDELNQIIKPAEDVIRKNLEKEGKKLPLTFIKRTLEKSVRDSDLEGEALTRALKKVEKEIAGYAQRADADGYVSLAKIHDAKVNKYATVNYMNPASGKADKVIAKALKEIVENTSKSVDVRKVNRELSRFYNMQSFLEKLDGKKVKGGKLGKYFAQTVGGIVGSHFGPIGTLVGANVSGRLQGSVLSKTLSGKTGQMPVRSQILEEAILSGKPNPTINLPQSMRDITNIETPINPINPIANVQTKPNNATNPIKNNTILPTIPPAQNKSTGVINKKSFDRTRQGGFIRIKGETPKTVLPKSKVNESVSSLNDTTPLTKLANESKTSREFLEKVMGNFDKYRNEATPLLSETGGLGEFYGRVKNEGIRSLDIEAKVNRTLKSEVKNYNTFDEFVKAKIDPTYEFKSGAGIKDSYIARGTFKDAINDIGGLKNVQKGTTNIINLKKTENINTSSQRYKKVLEEVKRGERTPLIIDENMEILDGHHRLEAYKAIGLKEIPVIAPKGTSITTYTKSQLEQIWKEANK